MSPVQTPWECHLTGSLARQTGILGLRSEPIMQPRQIRKSSPSLLDGPQLSALKRSQTRPGGHRHKTTREREEEIWSWAEHQKLLAEQKINIHLKRQISEHLNRLKRIPQQEWGLKKTTEITLVNRTELKRKHPLRIQRGKWSQASILTLDSK